MSIKLIAIDLDDTLLDSGLKISAPCMRSIQAAQKKGVIVTLATGRMYSSARPYAMDLQADVPLITYQGAMVKTSISEQILYYQPVPVNQAVEVMEFYKREGVHYHTYFDDRLCLQSLNNEGTFYARMVGVEPQIVPDLIGACRSGQEALKIMAVIHDERYLFQLQKVLEAKYGETLGITSSKPYFLEVTNARANKAEALKLVAEYYHIDREDILAVGDSYNDLSMIQWAGIGVAMQNARDTVKEAADYVTASNEEHGVAEAIEHFVL